MYQSYLIVHFLITSIKWHVESDGALPFFLSDTEILACVLYLQIKDNTQQYVWKLHDKIVPFES